MPSLQDIADLLDFDKTDWRTRGGDPLDVDALIQSASRQGLQFSSIDMEVLRLELRDRMDMQLAKQLDPALPPPTKYTVRWYQENADELVHPGGALTVRQACFCLAALKLRGGMTVQCLDDFCRLLCSGGFLSVDKNSMPTCVHPSVNAYFCPCSDAGALFGPGNPTASHNPFLAGHNIS